MTSNGGGSKNFVRRFSGDFQAFSAIIGHRPSHGYCSSALCGGVLVGFLHCSDSSEPPEASLGPVVRGLEKSYSRCCHAVGFDIRARCRPRAFRSFCVVRL